MALDDFVLKEQKQDINENIEENLRSQHKRLIKMKRAKDKDEEEGRPKFMITTAADVQEVCVVKGDIVKESAKVEDKGKREKKQKSADRAKEN